MKSLMTPRCMASCLENWLDSDVYNEIGCTGKWTFFVSVKICISSIYIFSYIKFEVPWDIQDETLTDDCLSSIEMLCL